jgi:hypothetical protein
MRTFTCSCKNTLYFDNVVCIKCKHLVGWCPVCAAIQDVVPAGANTFSCTQCKTLLIQCHNYAAHNVCNRFLAAPAAVAPGTPPAAAPVAPAEPLCSYCRFNKTIPDLSVAGNQMKWARIEAAKRRTLYQFDMLHLPYGDEQDGIQPPLAFEFKADIVPNGVYRDSGGGQKVFTGHANGTITLNIQEADDVAREKLRVEMHEPQRSLLGHFRHELGHYVWEVAVKERREADCIALFGDHNNPTYADALTTYYKNGPKPDWITRYVSAYATMHPWEDFAETFAVYLDMTSALHTAYHNGLIPTVDLRDLNAMVIAYQKLGIALNEMNRANGLLDYLPEVIAPEVHRKLAFIHSLAKPAAAAVR